MSAKRAKQLATKNLWLRGNVYWFAGSHKGQRLRISLETSDIAEAITKARAIRADPEQFLARPPAEGSVAAYFEHALRMGCSPGYCDANRLAIAKIVRDCGLHDARQMTPAAARTWLDREIDAGRARYAVQNLGRMRRLFRWMVEKRMITANPLDGIAAPKVPPRFRRQFLTRDQCAALFAAAKDDEMRFILFCGLHAGLRKAEIVASRPEWFDLSAGLLHVQNGPGFLVKDRDDRTIPLTDEFREFLRGYGLRRPYMIRPDVKPGRHRYRYDFRAAFARLMLDAGLGEPAADTARNRRPRPAFTFHDLRRTFASLHASAGTSLLIIAKWLGDGYAVVEKRYAHMIPNDPRINDPWREK